MAEYKIYGNYPLTVGSAYGHNVRSSVIGEKNMTVCVAALANFNHAPSVVFATDKAMTDGVGGDTVFEGKHGKWFGLSKGVYALWAGNAGEMIQVCQDAMNTALSKKVTDVGKIAEIFGECYRARRFKAFEREILSPINHNYNSFIQKQSSYPPQFVADILAHFKEVWLPVSQREFGGQAIIAGIDNTGPHLYCVAEPGNVTYHDIPGFVAIGSGWRHAYYYLMLNKYTIDQSFAAATFYVYCAKREGENDPHVGLGTDLVRVDSTGSGQANPDDIRGFEKIYKGSLDKIKKTRVWATNEVGKYLEAINAKAEAAQPIGCLTGTIRTRAVTSKRIGH